MSCKDAKDFAKVLALILAIFWLTAFQASAQVKVTTWGSNSQLGRFAPQTNSIPGQVNSLGSGSGTFAAAAGGSHSLAIKSDQTVLAWGSNSSGQLGDSTTVSRLIPTPVVNLTNISAISAGNSFSVALRSFDGSVWAWGSNSNGLGDNGPTQSSVPVQVKDVGGLTPLTGVTAIAAGNAHMLALKSGTVLAWGANNNGQLGIGNTSSSSTAVLVSGLSDIVGIAAGGSQSFAWKSDGTVYAWGLDSNGQLGDGMPLSQQTSPVTIFSSGSGVVSIAAGTTHTLALISDGLGNTSVKVWGSNFNGELGNGVAGGQQNTPIPVAGLTNVGGIAAGNSFSIAVKTNGTVMSWGLNGSGQLGDGSFTQRTTPVVAGGLTGITKVLSGNSHSLALKNDGSALGWGANTVGQLGRGTYDGSPLSVDTLTGIDANAVIATGAGGSHTLLRKSDGTVWAWGANNFGQMGIGSTSGVQMTPVQVKDVNGIGNISNVDAVAAGTTHSLALKHDGTVWAWGSNGNGQLGDNTATQRTTPVQVHGVGNVGFLTGITAIAAGTNFSLALATDGTVYAWGLNSSGQLGDNTGTQRTTPIQVHGVNNAGLLTGVTAISAGTNFSLALSAGSVYAWGASTSGQLGNTTALSPQRTPIQSSLGFTDVAAIAAGSLHSFAVRATNGDLWAWGSRTSGQLGDGTVDPTNANPQTTPIQITSGVSKVAGGGTHTLALKTDGSLWAWGNNSPSGQLGDGSLENRAFPAQTEVTGVQKFAAGNAHSVALTADSGPTDTTPPVISNIITGTLGTNGWYRSDVTVTWSMTDPESGIASSTGCSTTTTSETASLTLTCSATNGAGLTSSQSVTLKIDKTEPSISVTRTPANANGWNNGPVNVHFTISDTLSGLVGPGVIDQNFTMEGQNQTASITVMDQAGNSATMTLGNINIDTTPPTATFAAPSPAPNAAGWNRTDVTMSFTPADNLSGVASQSVASPFSFTTEGMNLKGTVTVTDGAGNSATYTSPGVNIDKTVPTVTFGTPTPSPNAAGWNKTDVSISFTTSDALSGIGSTSPTSPLTLTTEGSDVNGTVTATDRAGNTATLTSPSVKIDKTGPTIQFGTPTPSPNADGWNSSNVSISFTTSDALSGMGSTSPTSPLTLTTEGSNVTGTVTATDLAGNTTTLTSPSVKIDKTAPAIQFGSPTPTPNAAGWNKTDVGISFTVTDTLSGVAPGSPTSPLMLTTEGSNVTGSVTVTDLAGNSATVTSPSVKIDKTAPTVQFGTLTPAPNAAGWNHTNVSANFTATDALSGLAPGSPASPLMLTTEGMNVTGTVTVSDVAGNSATGTSPAVNIDKSGPAVTFTRTPAANAAGWNNTPVVVHFNVTDALSGVDGGNASIDRNITTEGQNQSTTVTATDIAGNTTTVTVGNINIDTTVPSIQFGVPSPAPNAAGWNNTNVTISYTMADNLSGVASASSPSPLVYTAEGSYIRGTVTVTDAAGNAASATSPTFKIDKTPPVVTATASPLPNANGWNTTDVTVTFTGVDGGSGIASCSPPVVFTSSGANQAASGTCTDLAGNVSLPATITINIDKSQPTFSGLPAPGCSIFPPDKRLVQIANITLADPNSGIGNNGISINVTANEPMDPGDVVITGGIVRVRATRQGNGNGRIYTVTARVVDRAGNTVVGSGTCAVPKNNGNGNGNGNGSGLK